MSGVMGSAVWDERRDETSQMIRPEPRERLRPGRRAAYTLTPLGTTAPLGTMTMPLRM